MRSGMRYEVCPIVGAATPPFRKNDDVNTIADEIASAYNIVAENGGRIVATHNLTCDVNIAKGDEPEKIARTDFLFLVVERPGDVPPIWPADQDCDVS